MNLINTKEMEINGHLVETVDARELHQFLESKQRFSDWIKNRIKQYDFTQDIDFITNRNVMTSPPSIEYIISLDMAKELSMVEHNDKGREVRKYFIECERKAKEIQPLTVDQVLEQNKKMVEYLRSQKIELVKIN